MKAFKIDQAGYGDILKQVRDSDFDKQLNDRLELAEEDKRKVVELGETTVASELQKGAAAKDVEIMLLKAQLDAADVVQKLAVTEALSVLEKERDSLTNQLGHARHANQIDSKLAEARLVNELQKADAD
jgi:hypothetical protein